MASPLDFDDKIKDDPKAVQSLLSAELMRLSINDRNAIQEEIHGVNCLAREENPELLDVSLRKLASELDRLPSESGRAYRLSQKLPNTYVNTLGFRLRFLRCELFDVRKAAFRIGTFLNLALEHFGEYALERPVLMSDFDKKELKYMRRGRLQWLPFRDRSGRRVVILFPGKGLSSIPHKIRMKIAMYTYWAAGDDIDTQLRGIVVLVWFDKSFDVCSVPMQNKTKLHEVASVRCCALHVCTPDTPFYRFRRAVVTMRAAHMRTQLRMHIGNSVELIYILQGYGIPTDTLPITYSGTIKIQAMRQWIRLRNFLEEPLYQNTEEIRSIIECPYSTDIVFRKGTSILHHPGNATFRATIASKCEEIDKRSEQYETTKETSKLRTRILVNEIMEEMERTKMRALNWDDARGFWEVLHDKSQIYLKVEYLVREHKNSNRALTNRQIVDSSTSVFHSQNDSGSCFCLGKTPDSKRNGTKIKGKERLDSAECFGMTFFDSGIRARNNKG